MSGVAVEPEVKVDYDRVADRWPLIYVAGPFRGATSWEVEANVRSAETAALEIWKLGAVGVCPHAMTRYFQGELPDGTWLDGDLALLRRCDGAYFLPRWDESEGACMEREACREFHVRIFDSMEEVGEFVRFYRKLSRPEAGSYN